jgi:hypothetical protein
MVMLIPTIILLGTACQQPADSPVDTAVPCEEQRWYQDLDGDGYGDPDAATSACEAPPAAVADDGDCDDDDPDVHPGADEHCDGFDEDCDRTVDEDIVYSLWYPDADGDGWGADTGAISACDEPAGYAPQAGDCDDANPDAWPGAPEGVCTTFDADCDGWVAAAAVGSDR